MKLNDFSRQLITRFPLGFVATVTPDGRPSLSPKGTFLVLDDQTLGFGEIRSPQTLVNLRTNPELEVNFVDQWLRKGVRIRGQAEILPRGGAGFEALIGQWQTIWGDLADRIGNIVKISVTELKPLTTPPYDDGVSEQEMIALYRGKFAELYP